LKGEIQKLYVERRNSTDKNKMEQIKKQLAQLLSQARQATLACNKKK